MFLHGHSNVYTILGAHVQIVSVSRILFIPFTNVFNGEFESDVRKMHTCVPLMTESEIGLDKFRKAKIHFIWCSGSFGLTLDNFAEDSQISLTEVNYIYCLL